MRNLLWCVLIIGFVLNADLVAQPELDTTFNSTGKAVFNIGARAGAWDTVVQPDNKIIMVSGCYSQTQAYFPFCTIRLNENGSLDTTFGNFGAPENYGPPGTVFTKFYSTFNQDGQAYGVALQNDGKIIVAGTIFGNVFNENIGMVRYNPNGTLDSSFGSGGKVIANLTPDDGEHVRAVAVQPDGKIVITGYSFHATGSPNFTDKTTQFIARYLANGTIDSSFGTGGIVRAIQPNASTSGQSLAFQSDGKILIGGNHWNISSLFPSVFQAYFLARLNTDGLPDTTWYGNGFHSINYDNPQGNSVSATSGIRSIAIQPDGRIVAIGSFSNILYRFNTNGSLDTSFDGDGSRQALISGREPYDLVISSGGAITVVGLRSWSQLPPSLPFLYYVARYKQDGSPDSSFSDDGHLEIDISSSTVDGARAVAKDSLGRIVIAGLAGDGNPNHPFENSIFSAARLLAPVASVGISGRITRSDGRPVANAILTTEDGAGTIITARTNPFGYYRFLNVQSGRTYTISVRAKKLVFTDRSVFVSNLITNFDFISEQP